MKVIALDGHPREEDLAAYVRDALEPHRADRLEAHVVDCPACAARLQDAASFEMLLHDAAASFEADRGPLHPTTPSLVRRLGHRVGAVGGLWAAAAAVALFIVRPGPLGGEPVPTMTLSDEPTLHADDDPRWSSGCTPGEAGCADGLLASVDPLESVDPLSSWPDDPLVRAGFGEADSLDGEPCGSGEDGGQLVCPVSDDPFSG
ncbi:MAG: hypothetical protein AB1Z98_10550 [Nannocystaceae bacterium]